MGNPERLGSNKWLPSNPEAGGFFQSAVLHCCDFITVAVEPKSLSLYFEQL